MIKNYFLTALALGITISVVAQSNVGIGTNAPASKMDVKGNLTVGNTYSGTAAPSNGAIIEGTVGIGTSSPSSKSALDVSSTSQGIFIPRMTTAQRDAIAGLGSSQNGLLIYNTDTNRTQYWNGSSWSDVGSGVGGPPTGAAGGDLTGTYPNPSIANGAVNSTKILDGTITSADMGPNSVDLSSGVVTNLLPVNRGGTGVGTLSTGRLFYGDGTNPLQSTNTPTGGQVIVANSSNVPAFQTLSGDVTINNTAVTDIQANTVGATELSATTVTAGNYGSATAVGTFTVDADGRLTAASNTTISGVAPGGTAGGDLNGTYPNPTVDGLQGVAVSATAPTATNNVLAWDGSQWAPANKGVPSGVIVMWSGTKAAIPAGWALCDGASGTPNLLDKFVLSVAVSAYTGSDINQTGGNSNHTLTVAELPAHYHTGTSDATTPSGSFSGTAATISHTGSFTGTAATTSSTNTDHTHTWGGTWNSDQSNLGGSPYGDGNSSIYTDGVGYWSMSTGGGITTTSTNTDHTHGWGGVWTNDDSRAIAYPYGDGGGNTYSDGTYGIYYWGTGGVTVTTTGGYAGDHSHGVYGRGGASGYGGFYEAGGGGGYTRYTWTGGGHTHTDYTLLPNHRHYIQPRNTGTMSANASHSHTVYNHRHWIQIRNTGAMSANASHSHSFTATGTISINNASYTPAGTVSVGNHTHTFTTNNTGSGSVIDIRPSFYRLAYIMKL